MSWLSPLIEVVTQHWGTTGKAYNLARVKPELVKRNVNLELHLGNRKLKDAIVEDASTELRVIRNPEKNLTWGIVPQNVELPANVAELFQLNPQIHSQEPSVRISRGVWLAFSKPLKPGARRFLEIKRPSPAMHEIFEGQPLPPSGLEVLPEYVWSPNAELLPDDRDRQILDAVKRWAKEKNVSIDDLVRREELLPQSAALGERGNRVLLDITALSQAEKARILIPLDLLEKIGFGK